MSKFKVGDRVVVVRNTLGSIKSFVSTRGEVAELNEDDPELLYNVVLDTGVRTNFAPEELEFEHVYDELSKKPADEAPLLALKVDTRPSDAVSHPSHYTSHPSGVECIQVTEHMDFLTGNIFKYLWRMNSKHETPLEDLKKARFYLDRLIAREEKRAGLE
ncbi:DUF3310 domain-containing protein [Streptomyces althioticus]|uniref:DUF3310 domain-containing protein n=1 Tax=Streptomyces althioticus TaxID=83380 RepID=UPI0034052E48